MGCTCSLLGLWFKWGRVWVLVVQLILRGTELTIKVKRWFWYMYYQPSYLTSRTSRGLKIHVFSRNDVWELHPAQKYMRSYPLYINSAKEWRIASTLFDPADAEVLHCDVDLRPIHKLWLTCSEQSSPTISFKKAEPGSKKCGLLVPACAKPWVKSRCLPLCHIRSELG